MNNCENKIEGIHLADIFPIIEEKIASGGKITFKPHGISMLPLIRQGVDSVQIERIENEPKILDVIFYRRKDGQFVLHRIIGKDKNGYILCGDNQYVKEHGITSDMIIGVMTGFFRNGKEISGMNSKYRFYCRLLWIRRAYLKIRRFLGRIKSKITIKGGK